MLFSPLEKAKAGMKIYITDKKEKSILMSSSVETVTPDRVDVIQDREGVNEITLVTCEDAAATSPNDCKGNLKHLLTMTRFQRHPGLIQ